MKKFLKVLLVVVLVCAMLVSCKSKGDTSSNSDTQGVETMLQFSPMTKGEQVAVIKTSMGDISVRFFPEIAPKAVMNFVNHAADGYYDNTTFHRVMNDFMIQGGDPEGTGRGGESIWGKPFEDEFSQKLYNFRGALCMANRGSNTNGSQFFIVQTSEFDASTAAPYVSTGWHTSEAIRKYKEVGGCFWLDGAHTVFGQVYEGMEVVDAIAAVAVDASAKPLADVVVYTVEIRNYPVEEDYIDIDEVSEETSSEDVSSAE